MVDKPVKNEWVGLAFVMEILRYNPTMFQVGERDCSVGIFTFLTGSINECKSKLEKVFTIFDVAEYHIVQSSLNKVNC